MPVQVETVEPRLLLTAVPGHAVKQGEVASRVSAKLLELHDDLVAGSDALDLAASARLSVDARQRVGVTLRADDVELVAAALVPLGFQLTASFPALHFAEGLMPIRSLRAVGQLTGKLGRFGIQPGFEPLTLTGAVDSQADFVMEADRVRATLPAAISGAGQRVGVLSDSYNRLGGAPADVASGDLPTGVTVVEEAGSGGTDEGRAMLQLVHDLAPGAALAFATAFGGEGNFAQNIRRLADPASYADGVGAGVIVDDVVYFGEPMFQDGVVAQAIDEVVTTRGVNYFSAAGNQASQAYESTAFQTATDPTFGANRFDFDPGPGADTRQRITVPAHGRVVLAFQWDDPFYTSGGVDTDLDLFLIDPSTTRVVAAGESDNLFFQDPVEVVGYTNPTASALALDVAILKFAGPNPGRIKYVNYGNPFTSSEWATNSPTVIPHAAAVHGQGVGAVPYFNQRAPEGFTSKGPSTILFSPSGSRIAAQVRQTPQIAAADGTNTTFFGEPDFEGDGRPNFFGTSAAAPHAGAAAALVRQANPSFAPAQVYARLQATADDVGPSGFDNLTGFGLVNAYDAVYPTVTPAAPAFLDGLEGGALSAAYETRSTGPGRIRVTGDDGPFAGARHLVLDASVGTGSGLNEVTLHVDATGTGRPMLSFRHREFEDDDHPMPATFSGSSNSDGVAMSVDGVNWVRLVGLTGAASGSAYAPHTFDLSAVAATHGLALTADTRIRFQQFGAAPSPDDGFAFDEIRVATPATVAGRRVFYNNSWFDTPTAANPGFNDDTAIATDKVALLPGGTAIFANYTSYSRGINGIMVDVAGLADPAGLGAADFAFRVGNDGTPGAWAAAPAPASVTLRPGEGIGGSDRVAMTWADNAIRKQWLQVTVLPTARTGLAAADVFYFGNAVADSGNSATDARVNTTDEIGARNNPRTFQNRAPVDFRWDYNRDSVVNSTDQILARNNGTTFHNDLNLIIVPTAEAEVADVPLPQARVRSATSPQLPAVATGMTLPSLSAPAVGRALTRERLTDGLL